jgi:hypothetical protein
MTNVVQLIPRVDDQPASSDQSGLLLHAVAHIVALTKHVADQAARIADQAERIAALEARSPAPPFEIPPHWVNAKRAAHASGYSRQSIYRFFHSRQALGIQQRGTIYLDPDSLPEKRSRQRRK